MKRPLILLATLLLSAASAQNAPLPNVAIPLGVVQTGQAAQTTYSTTDILSNTRATLSLKVWLNKDPSGVGMSQYSVGDPITVSVQPSADAYIYLFDVGSDGHISLFAPNGYDGPRGNWVRGGQKATFPRVGAGYSLTVGGPLGQNRILALASRQPLSLSDIATFAGQQGFGRVSLQGEAALGQALAGAVSQLQVTDWATTYTWYGVGEPGQGNPEPVAAAPVTVQPAPTQPVPVQPKPEPSPAPIPITAIQVGERPDHTFDSAIQEGYSRIRGAASLGQPSSYATPFDGGTWQKFNGVAAYGKGVVLHQAGAAAAYAVHGKVLDRYLSLAQAESGLSTDLSKVPSRLGWPTGDEKILPRNTFGRTGFYAPFAAGALYSSDKGTFWLTGDLLAKYQGLGGAGSSLGFPVRDQFLYNGHWAAQFEGGRLIWNGKGYSVSK